MDVDWVIRLLAKKWGNTATEEEQAVLKDLLNRHPELGLFNELLESIESDKQHRESIEEEQLIADSWIALKSNLNVQKKETNEKEVLYPWMKKPKKRFISLSFQWAAVWVGILLIAGSIFLLWHQRKGHTKVTGSAVVKVLQTSKGAPEKNILPDGSIVWLNGDSHIRYTTDPVQNKREVFLEGEAYFNVKHDAGRPFIVHAANVAIRVLGTTFNVQAYANEDQVETTLIDGKIQVQISGNPDKNIVLRPNEKLTVANQTFNLSDRRLKRPDKDIHIHKELSFKVEELAPTGATSPLPEVAWLQDKLAFQNERFDELAKKLERRYDVQIMFNDVFLKRERLSGVFKNENIQKALKILQMTTPFAYKIRGDTVMINRPVVENHNS